MGLQNLRKIGIRNKKGLEFKSAFFAIIVIGIVITAASVTLVEWNTEYQSGITPDLSDYNQGDEIGAQGDIYEGRITPSGDNPDDNFEAETFRGGYGIITNLFTPLKLVYGEGGMLDSIGDRFGIPGYIISGIAAMMSIAIIFSIVAIVFRLSRRSA